MKGLPKIVFDSAAFAQDDAAAAWAHFNSKTHTVTVLERADRAFSTVSTTWVADRVFFTDARLQLQTKVIRASSAPPAPERRAVLGWLCKTGGGEFLHEGRPVSIRPGDFFMFNLAGDISGLMLDMDVFAVIIPHSEIDFDPQNHPHGIVLEAETPEAQAIRTMIEASVEALPTARTVEGILHAERAKALIRPLFHDYEALQARPKPLRRQVLDYVDEQILTDELTLERVMQTFNLSRARIYDVLDLAVPFDVHVAIRRLDFALRSLVFGAKDRARLSLIAKRLGYPSREDFAGAFMLQFGFPPEMVLGVLSAERPAPGGKLWSTWLGDGETVRD